MRRRLVLAIALVAAASVALFALPLALALRETYRDDERIRLERDTVGATRQIDLTTQPNDTIELPASHDHLAVFDLQGRRVTGAGPAVADAVVKSALASGRPSDNDEDGHFVTAVPLLVHERVAGAVRASRSDDGVVGRTHRAWWRLLALGTFVVILAVLAALALGRRIAVPLERLASAARRLGDGDFSTRAPRAGVGELDAVAEALDATARRLDELVSRERAFSADASHQLRTPLAALRIELEALELEGRDSEELARALGEVDRLQSTIDTLLAVARDVPRAETEADLQTLLDQVEQDWRPALAERARPLHLDAPNETTVARADPGVVREILGVLVANACLHGAGAVTVRARPAGDWITIEVCDEGPGVADTEGVFERRTPGSDDGHGIGLALARSLAHAEGGRLTLAATGPRPTFTLMLARFPPPQAGP